MQAQRTRNTTETISQTQSLAAVQTLLRAGLGAITFLRNLLPEENFTRSHFTSVDDSSTSEPSMSQPDSSQDSSFHRTNVNGFTVMTITRGYTDEADKLLNYLEHGIFDALEKRYLRSFIFGIYLDNKDPNNIIEAYTFNFKYHTIPGSRTTIPVMTLEEGQNTSLRNKKKGEDPVEKAVKQGRAPTLKEVKMSVKSLLKTLIQAMNHMDVLPRRRFATFKIFYTDETPLDYEPPNFQTGDVDKDRWYFMTHDLDEVPDRCAVGSINTGHHSVNLSVTSIASYLPSSTEHDEKTFAGTTSQPGRPNLTPQQEAALCESDAEKQIEDAENRNIVWTGEDNVELDADADGEDDPDYILRPGGQYEKIDNVFPIGIRSNDGQINPLPIEREEREAQYCGVSEEVPKHLQDVVTEMPPVPNNFAETQELLLTPRAQSSNISRSRSDASTLSPISTVPGSPGSGFDPDMLKNMSIADTEMADTEMLDLETQALNQETGETESIQSFPQDATRAISIIDQTPGTHPDKGLQCDCGINLEDISLFCEGGCNKWFHVWCMGYHSVNDPRIPLKFSCFDCRLRSDISWELIKIDLYPRMISKFKDLGLFRRAIKTAEKKQKFTLRSFSKSFGANANLSGEMLKKLEEDEFILRLSTAVDDHGLTITSVARKGKNKGKSAAKNRKVLQKTQYMFNVEIVRDAKYLNYFKPDDTENDKRLLGVSDMLAKRGPYLARRGSETQDETQYMAAGSLKRPAMEDLGGILPAKKVKMSVAIGVDLAE